MIIELSRKRFLWDKSELPADEADAKDEHGLKLCVPDYLLYPCEVWHKFSAPLIRILSVKNHRFTCYLLIL